MIVSDIYTKFRIPPNLQTHMLRVAALADVLTRHWNGNRLDRQSVVQACLFHDMANIIKFDFSRPALFKDEEDATEYWKTVQRDVIAKYGTDIHAATLAICREIGLPERVLSIIDALQWNNAPVILKNNDYVAALAIYCDMRIGPYGILPLRERINDLGKRNSRADLTFVRKAGLELEQEIQSRVSIDVRTIQDAHLQERFSVLMGTAIIENRI